MVKGLPVNAEHSNISTANNLNIQDPFIRLARKLTGKGDLFFTDAPLLAPPIVTASVPIFVPIPALNINGKGVQWVKLSGGGVMKINYKYYPEGVLDMSNF